ncbi:anaerobic C4-dicarboxylate transporter family protein [Rhodococcus tukisamuensis]|uniref:Anaerobic C4-dicarboxylate transporter DcuA/anaerobic C4-dicarboxylate transporter DcuB n=1 Tax=Rhodococcus tukisamuensis TaxID=168276 RepID=A0A1G6VX30_9NOCA|nr:anaerobic C4-dicarboxylate transporter family protein [Rhodococcus tukisamuensis]SDD58131.1 anaerobic C4-dicarboxylate transporter DcuA/anaerobic C4-dicarboxylate transporter DcuB [Rhodococcus tukisamuensis]
MDSVKIVLELIVVLGAIVMGTRSSGVALGLWGGAGVAVLVFVFGEDVGSPPVDALLIILSVVLASSMMQVAGGIDWMVTIAADLIAKRPKQITLIAPLVSFLFSVGAGTSNILYPLLPVIYDASYRNGIRPSRPLSLSVVATGVALACSPVSAAMAAMVTLTDVAPYNFELIDIIMITLPAAVIGIILSSIVVNRLGKDIEDDPEIQARIASGAIAAPSGGMSTVELKSSTAGRNAALIFLLGVAAIVVFGLFKGIRPEAADGSPMGMTPIIEMIMFLVGTLILLVSRPNVADVPTSSVFKAGMVSAIALFGLAWLTDTFISAHLELITSTVGDWVNAWPWIFALGVFLVCVLTTSQSTATRTIVPIGLAAGLAPGLLTGMWAGAFAGIYLLPTNGSQIAAANFDESGSTKLGTKLVDHSFFVPTLVLAVTTITAGSLIGLLLG